MPTNLVFESSVKRRLLSLAPGRNGSLYGISRPGSPLVLAFTINLPQNEQLFTFPVGITRLASFQTHDQGDSPEPSTESSGDDDILLHLTSQSQSDLKELPASEVSKGLWLVHCKLEASDLHEKGEFGWYESLLQGGKGIFIAPNGATVEDGNPAPLLNFAPQESSRSSNGSNFTSKPKSKGKSKGKGKGKGKKTQKSRKGRDGSIQGWQLPTENERSCVLVEEDDRLQYGARGLFESIQEFQLFFDAGSTEKEAPILRFETRKRLTSLGSMCSIEVAMVVSAEEPVGDVKKQFFAALRSHLRMMEEKPTTCNWMLFFPNALQVPVVVKCVAGDEDDLGGAVAAHRKKLHELLALELDSPYFRRMNTLRNTSTRLGVETGVLRSPHLGKYGRAHGVSGGEVYMIEGDFDYYHYTSNAYDDRGWGCAYRSFQMAFSWFRLAGFTEKLTPSIAKIQEKLHDMDVMDAHFYIGCKQWIGSQEVAWLLEDGIGASSRFLVCSRGAEIVEKARELATHFETHKSPIIMCGSNLALTLLGIAWNAESGQVSFLIADPHYTGADDLEAIQQKQVALEGYRAIPVSWRGPEAFSSNANYTLCMPLRPQVY